MNKDEINKNNTDGVQHTTPAGANIFEEIGFGHEEAAALLKEASETIMYRRKARLIRNTIVFIVVVLVLQVYFLYATRWSTSC